MSFCNLPPVFRCIYQKKNNEVLLKEHEIIVWENMKNKLKMNPKQLNNYADPNTVEIIKGYLHPKIWIPSPCKSSHANDRSNSPNRSKSPPNSNTKKVTVRIFNKSMLNA